MVPGGAGAGLRRGSRIANPVEIVVVRLSPQAEILLEITTTCERSEGRERRGEWEAVGVVARGMVVCEGEWR